MVDLHRSRLAHRSLHLYAVLLLAAGHDHLEARPGHPREP
jgi:hypothetical protein